MSWLARLSILFLAVVLGFSACKRPDHFGSEVQPNGSELGLILVDTFAINASTVLLDSFSTGYVSRLMVGQYNDPMTGKLTAECYSQVRPVQEAFSFSIGSTFDSLVLVIMPNYFYGDTTATFGLDVYRLAQAMDTSMRFSNQKELQKEATPLGSATFIPGRKRISIKLNSALGQEMFTKGVTGSTDPDYATYAAFNAYFKGIALVPKDGNKCVMGMGTSFSVSDSAGNFVRMYTHDNYGNNINYNFALNSASISYNKFSHDFSGTPLASLQKQGDIISSELTGNQTFIQGGASLMTKLTFPSLAKFKTSSTSVAIVKAELYIKPNNADQYTPPLYVNIYNSTSTNRVGVQSGFISYINEVSLNGSYGKSYAFIDSSDYSYRLPLTSYIQDVVYGKVADPSILLGCGLNSMSFYPYSYSANNVSSINRMAINDSKAVLDRLRLRVYYQPLK